MRARHFLLFLTAVMLLAGCQTSTTHERDLGDLAWPGKIISYQKAVSQRHGIVGYVKEFEYGKTGAGVPFRAFHVYDLDFEERGILNQSGTGVRFVDLPPATAKVKGRMRDEIQLEAQPLELNVAVILGVDRAGPVKLSPAEEEDLQKPE